MAKIPLYERTIENKAERLAKKFPEKIRRFARRTIELLLESGRDLAIVDGKIEQSHHFYTDSTKYRTSFEDYTQVVSDYCEYALTLEKPLTALNLLSNPDYLCLIRLFSFRKAIKEGLHSNMDKLKEILELLKNKNISLTLRITEKSERVEESESGIRDYHGLYKRTPYDGRPNHPRLDSP